jgi:hypothetical protein
VGGIRDQDDVAHPARVDDYWLGGEDNFPADRALAEAILEAVPIMRTMVRANRAFLGRAVRHLTRNLGIRQFLDIGTGSRPLAQRTAFIAADLRQPEAILGDPTLAATVDLGRPVAVMLVAILMFLPDAEDPLLIAEVRAATPGVLTARWRETRG